MPVTQDYKTVTFSGRELAAVQYALVDRVGKLQSMLAERLSQADREGYERLLVDAVAAKAVVGA
jgi:hypothetical protein